MAHPKRNHSNARRDKRRTHYKTKAPNIVTCSVTGEPHLWHRAYVVEGNLYYKGKILVENFGKV